mgnify:CR=1 FL=1
MDAETVKKLLGRNIKSYRCSLGLTQSQLGKKINIDQRQVAYIENGHSFPSLSTLLKFAKVFNCELKSFFDFGFEDVQIDIKNQVNEKISKMSSMELEVCYSVIGILEKFDIKNIRGSDV